jgi:hypothetical protein
MTPSTGTTSTIYIAAATNRFPHAAHASNSSLAALGSGTLIGLWDVTVSCIGSVKMIHQLNFGGENRMKVTMEYTKHFRDMKDS